MQEPRGPTRPLILLQILSLWQWIRSQEWTREASSSPSRPPSRALPRYVCQHALELWGQHCGGPSGRTGPGSPRLPAKLLGEPVIMSGRPGAAPAAWPAGFSFPALHLVNSSVARQPASQFRLTGQVAAAEAAAKAPVCSHGALRPEKWLLAQELPVAVHDAATVMETHTFRAQVRPCR